VPGFSSHCISCPDGSACAYGVTSPSACVFQSH
jgi:hypothetical protein